MTIDEQVAYLTKGAAETIRVEDLRAKLEQSAQTGKPLRVYLGVDPTAPDLHLGHTVVIRKLKHFQDVGHTAIFLIGDFSAMIGDPTGRTETRPPLSREQVDANAKTYLDQVFKILDPKKTEIRYNSEWLSPLTSDEIVKLCAKYRLARMLEHDDFRSRLANNLPIAVHELLYPLLTAYDAVVLRSDVELGATEQKFNLLVHREIQREFGLSPQAILTMPILEGLDGVQKMSKSLGNYVSINESQGEMYGKVMSISDELMWRYYLLLTDLTPQQINELKSKPMQAKKSLARRIVSDFHGEAQANQAQRDWERQFQGRGVANVPPLDHVGVVGRWDAWLVEIGLCKSKTEAQRQMKAGAVSVAWGDLESPNWRKITDPVAVFDPYAYPRAQDHLDFAFKVGREQKPFRIKFPPTSPR